MMNLLQIYCGVVFSVFAVGRVVCNSTDFFSNDGRLGEAAVVKIYPEQSVVNVPASEPFVLTCIAHDEGNNVVTDMVWRDPSDNDIGEEIRIYSTAVQKKLSRYQLQLRFSQPQVRDSGKYTCCAVYSYNETVEATVEMKFYDGIKFDNCSGHQTLVLGTAGEITCTVTGNPFPQITWLKDGLPIVSNWRYTVQGGRLLVAFVTEDSEEQYAVEAVVFQTGEFAKRTINVTVESRTKSACSSREFRCDNGRCVLLRNVCNGYNDCGDWSDERSCRVPTTALTTCGYREFRCDNGRCINANYRCDGDNDCGDWSDEYNCNSTGTTLTTCGYREFRCDNGRCIHVNYRCDGDNDCGDWSDERNCPSTRTTLTTCGYREFRCDNGQCINANYRCDGYNDCGDWSDERNCTSTRTTLTTCGYREFRCDNGRCINANYRCDGDNDCGDWSDESGCFSTGRPACSRGMFTCRNGRCIRARYVCDGDNDCGDFSDESDCPATVPRTRSNLGVVIGVTVGFSALVLLFILTIWCVKIRKQKNKTATAGNAQPARVVQTPQQLPERFPQVPTQNTQNSGSQERSSVEVLHQPFVPGNVTRHPIATYPSPELHQPPTSPQKTQQHGDVNSTVLPDQVNAPQPNTQQIPPSNLYPTLPPQAYPTAPESSSE